MDAFVTVDRKQRVMISDLKTRVNSSLPRVRHSRASEMQLNLYYQLLSNMINGIVDIKKVYAELTLDSEAVFSDGFLVEVGSTYADGGVLTFEMVLKNNNLNVSPDLMHTYERNFGMLS